MAGDKSYFIFNKAMDYRRGYASGMTFENGFVRPSGDGSAYFISRLLDSRESRMEWHRLRMKLSEQEESRWNIYLYCSDSRTVYWENEVLELDDVIYSEQLTLEEKKQRMKSCLVKMLPGQSDILLHDVTGRHLWFCLQPDEAAENLNGISQLKVEFPRRSWIQYLPEPYQRRSSSQDLMERFLGVFQSVYEDMTVQIEQTHFKLDPDSTDMEFLTWMAGWMALDDAQIWDEQQLRYLIRNAMSLYQTRGTVRYLKTMLELYTGCEPYIVEHHHINRFQNNMAQSERLRSMYSDNAYVITILINTGRLNTQKEHHTLVKIAEHALPAHIQCRVVLLHQYILLDQHTYLGVNSRLNWHRPIQLDGLSAIHFTKIED